MLPRDLESSEAVGSGNGKSGTCVGIGTIIAFKVIAHSSDAWRAEAILFLDPSGVVAGFIPLFGRSLVLLLLHNAGAIDQWR